MLEQAIHFLPVSIVAAFAIGAIVLGVIDYRRDKTVYVAPPVPAAKENERLVPRFDTGETFSTVEEIHAHYAEMKETDPKRAGREMYQHQLKLHGQ